MRKQFLLFTLAVVGAGLPSAMATDLPTTSEALEINSQVAYDCTYLRSDFISSVSIGDGYWGNWACPSFCPPDSYAYDIRLKSEPNQGSGVRNGKDDTALNGVALWCRDRDGSDRGYISSFEGPWGSWASSYTSCPEAYAARFPIVGGRMRIEGKQGGDDDTAANSVRVTCADGTELQPPARTGWGGWNSTTLCPANTAVCGMSTRVEGYQGSGPFRGAEDDTSLNGVRLYCCVY